MQPASFFLLPAAQAAALVDDVGGVVKVVAAAEDAGANVYLVGGAVRNLLLGRPLPSDYDFVTSGSVELLAKAVAVCTSGTAFILDKAAPSYRVTFKAGAQSFFLDISPIKGRSAGIAEDLMGRDFTVNAMAVDVRALIKKSECRVIDPCAGAADAQAGILRPVSLDVFKSDPLRMLRAIRLAQQYGLKITEEIIGLIKEDAGLLAPVSAERIRDELVAIFACKRTSASIRLMFETGLMSHIVAPMKGWDVDTGYDILAHTLKTVDEAETLLDNIDEERFGKYYRRIERHFSRAGGGVKRAVFFKLAAFLHDIGKPSTMTSEDGRLRFYGHDHKGSMMALDALGRLRFSRRVCGDISKLVKCHHRVFALADLHKPTPRAKAHLFRSVGGDTGVDLLCLALADARATRGSEDLELLRVVQDMLRFYYDIYIKKSPQPVMTGSEVMKAFALAQGPLIGEILKKIAKGVETGAVRTKKDAADMVKKLLKDGSLYI